MENFPFVISHFTVFIEDARVKKFSPAAPSACLAPAPAPASCSCFPIASSRQNMLGLNSPNGRLQLSSMPSPIEPNDGQRTILIVDDFDDTRLLLRTWLEKKGYRVVEAENGNEAVAQAEAQQPDLIIMDVEMPELDGLSATRKIRGLSIGQTVPIVAVSAYGADQFRDDALAAGCNEYVPTPFEPDELEKLIQSLIR
jgi:two-component system cell cycle response regulator DivK